MILLYGCKVPPSAENSSLLKEEQEDIIRSDFRIMFYNVENLFDPFNDSLRLDDEFLPNGTRGWTWDRYRKKCLQIGKMIVAVGGEEVPDLVGLCEVENRFVLDGIIKYSPLMKMGYQLVHRESPDRRGIDVALLYQPDRFHLIAKRFLPVFYRESLSSSTREILYAKGVAVTGDTLHVFVNHWPSRWGGQLESEHKRNAAAHVLRNCLDSIGRVCEEPLIVVMGDFNDYPTNTSITDVLMAESVSEEVQSKALYNLARERRGGSHKYRSHWGWLDQIMVSGALMKGIGFLQCRKKDFHLYSKPYLFEPDKTYLGQKPFRTYSGYTYQGGFSDHLPVYLDLWRK